MHSRAKAVSCYICRYQDADHIRRTDVRVETTTVSLIQSLMLCLAGRAGACNLAAAMKSWSTSRPHASDMPVPSHWHVTGDYSAKRSDFRCLGMSWHVLAPTLFILLLFHLSGIQSLSPCCHSNHPYNAYIANMSSFKKADTTLGYPQGQIQLRIRPEHPYVLCCVTSRPPRGQEQRLLVDTL